MHPNRKFHLTDGESMTDFVRHEGFGTLIAKAGDGMRAVHVPILLDGERLRFHVSRSNEVHPGLMAGENVLVVVNGPHAYVSPDWYGLDDRVPTWNYVAVELEGRVRPLDTAELGKLLDDLAHEHESRLAPKPAWTRDRMSPERFEGLMKAITGFEMAIASWRGTAKIDQDKPEDVRRRIADALHRKGEGPMAALMRSGFPGK
ncbi:MAG: FMN-binding negative transcriptional regulator [Alphaproteobacteria bacterium]|nr:FMN-binding negative transcriptional regulator [Alphaproteobacteria bacterium]MBV9371594.1 FMN-binding negative transcriptional regulator [Alphaproteobacteria bacterium]MBV9902203.1 FMN-binding negative transcriptional regulator [Alphaproteobacteria bacterium]